MLNTNLVNQLSSNLCFLKSTLTQYLHISYVLCNLNSQRHIISNINLDERKQNAYTAI